MGKESGLGARLYVAGVDLSGDVGSLQSIRTPRGVQQATGIDKDAFERIYLTRDGGIDYSAFFNPETAADDPPNTQDRAHIILSALPTADQPVTYAHRAALGAPAASMVGKQINYDPTRGNDGSLTIGVQALANGYGLEWGELLTAGDAQLTPGAPNGAGFDSGIAVATLFGLQAYLHVLAFVGTDVTLSIQDSNDGGTDPWANVTGAVFAQVTTAPGSQRLQTARNQAVKRWLRVAATGTFTSVDVVVMVVKNTGLVVF